tara:strand:+ start:593 stop:1486 length:894 start_codon:yes stop_codon:yes gene_type:complete
MNEMRITIQREARRLLQLERVSVVIGYETGPYPGTTSPCFAFTPDDAQRIVFNSFSAMNLAVYLPGITGNVGIVATPATVRSIKELEKDGLVKRQNIHIIGVRFPGILDPRKLSVNRENENTLSVNEHPEALWDWALHDLYEVPSEYDILVEPRWMSELDKQKKLQKPILSRTNVERLQQMTHKERRAYWLQYFEENKHPDHNKNLFPSTYSGGDHLEKFKYIKSTYSSSELFYEHLSWVYQSMGRASGFDLSDLTEEPTKIPLSTLRAWAAREFRRNFDYRPGFDDTNPLLKKESL